MKRLPLLLIAFLSVQVLFAQPGDKAKMQKEREEIQKELKEIQANYNKIKGQQKVTIGQVTMLQNKMQVQSRYISNINNEIKILTDDIYTSNVELTRLQRQLDTLKAEYARSVVYTYKNNSSYDYLNFIFSASSFNDALRRVSYLKSYRAYNESKVQNIKATQALIEQRKQQLLGKTNQKKSALDNQKDQLNELESQKKEKDQVFAKLKSQANNLSKQIATKKKRDNALRSQINAIVAREMRKAQEEENRRLALLKEKEKPNNSTNNSGNVTSKPNNNNNKPVAKKTVMALNEVDMKLAASFNSNRGKLPWPVDNGYVSIPFGNYNLDGVILDNPCLSISTPSASSPVKAVFDGTVSAVTSTGEGMFVMIRHGNYFTGYTLASASVNKDDVVKTGQVIGRTAAADDGSGGQIDFYLLQETRKINPRPWLR